jgi:hypothetical protein
MFKIALCLSGQPRSYEKGYEYHKKNLLDHYHVDVYFHTWYDEAQSFQHIEELYNAIDYSVSDPFYLKDVLQNVDNTFKNVPDPKFPARNTWLMFNSMAQSYRTMMNSKVQYDVVIRSRFDYALNVKLPYEETQVGKVYVPSDRMTPNHDFCADMFAFGTPKVMDTYMTTAFSLYEHYDNGTIMIGEDMLAAQLKKHGLVGKNMVYVNMNNPFPPGPYNGNWHSLIRDDFKEWNDLRD